MQLSKTLTLSQKNKRQGKALQLLAFITLIHVYFNHSMKKGGRLQKNGSVNYNSDR